jgi:hypothetical protein
MTKIRIDGIEYDADSPALVQAIEKYDAKRDAEISELKKERDEITAKHDATSAELDKTKQELAEARDPERLAQHVAARVDLCTKVRKVLGDEAKLDGKSDREIMLEAIRHDEQDFDAEDKSDDYVRAYFEASIKRAERTDAQGVGAFRGAARRVRQEERREDGQQENRTDAMAARTRMLEANQKAALEPLRYSRDN